MVFLRIWRVSFVPRPCRRKASSPRPTPHQIPVHIPRSVQPKTSVQPKMKLDS